MKFFSFLILIMLLTTQCQSKNQGTDSLSLPLTAQNISNLSYGPDSAQKLDLYLPEGRSSSHTPLMILIHGGGWNSGNKSDFNHYIDSFRKRMPDMAFANLNYRLYNGGNRFPVQEEDVKTAVDLLVSRAQQYGYKPNGLIILGASAGGHLALLQAYKNPSPRFAAVIDFFGPTDLTEMYNHPWHPMVTYALDMITGTNPDSNPALYHDSSPVNYIRKDLPPTLIFHGDKDPVVDLSQSERLAEALKKSGVPHQLVVYPGQRHGWWGPQLSKSFDTLQEFLEKHLG